MSDKLVRAFPQSIPNDDGTAIFYHGLYMRDYFAAKAMQSLPKDIWTHADLAGEAYRIADAMMEAREL